MPKGAFHFSPATRSKLTSQMIPKGKHFINGIADPVERALRVSLYGSPSLRLLEKENGTLDQAYTILFHHPADTT